LRSSPQSANRLEQFEAFCAAVGLELEPFQRMILAEFFAGRREILALLPRGNGKTTLFAAVGTFHLLTTREPAVYCAAAGTDQARLLFESARNMAARHPEIDRRVTARYRELRVDGGFMRILSSDAPRAHGLAPTLALVDELWAHATPDLYTALRTALGKRAGAQLVTITTAGYDHESVLGRLRERALALPAVKRQGALTTATSEHFSMFEWACTESDDLTDPKILKAANPASFVGEEFLAEQIDSPGLHPLEIARLHANVWTATAESWLPVGGWQACAADYTIEAGEPVWVGVDVGGERSASAVCWVTEDLRVGSEIFYGDEAVLDCLAKVRELADELDVREVAFDPWHFSQAAIELEREGLPVVAFPQSNSRMVPASAALYAAVKERRVQHPNDPDLNRHLAAVVARQTERGPRLDKAKSRHQIDAAVALSMAIERAEAPKPQPVELLGWL
jgi:phage terminase large subunit-like protein